MAEPPPPTHTCTASSLYLYFVRKVYKFLAGLPAGLVLVIFYFLAVARLNIHL